MSLSDHENVTMSENVTISGCMRPACLGCRGGQPRKKKRASGTAAARNPEAEAASSTDALSEVIAQEGHAQMPLVVGIVEDRKKFDLELNEVPIKIHPACAAHRDTPDSCCKQARTSFLTEELSFWLQYFVVCNSCSPWKWHRHHLHQDSCSSNFPCRQQQMSTCYGSAFVA